MLPTSYCVEVAARPEELDEHLPAWWELHTNRLEDDVYASPTYLSELFRHFGDEIGGFVAFVYRGTAGAREMVASVPFGTVDEHRAQAVLNACRHELLAGATPLLHEAYASEAAAALIEWLGRPRQPWSIVRWSKVSLQSRAWTHLAAGCVQRHHRWWVRREFDRAVLRRRGSFEQYQSTLSRARREAWQSAMRALRSMGEVEIKLHRSLRDYDLIRRFLQIEARASKGARGAMLSARRRNAEFFDSLTRRLADCNDLFFVEILLNDAPVSMSANFVDGRSVFGFKIAYEPAYRHCAPAVLNVIEFVRLLHADPVLQFADSTAVVDHAAEDVLPDSLPVGTALVALEDRSRDTTASVAAGHADGSELTQSLSLPCREVA